MVRRRGEAYTWWGKRWTSALEALGAAWRSRLPRGRTYAREGRVVGLTVEAGRVTSYVVGSEPSPYEVEIRLEPLPDDSWHLVVEALMARAAYIAKLLAGEMPDDIDDAFSDCGVSLFPEQPSDLQLACTCPDKALPCKHIAATHFMLGETFDYDPFLLFALRGRDRDALLGEVREARAVAVDENSQSERKKARAAERHADADSAAANTSGTGVSDASDAQDDPGRGADVVCDRGFVPDEIPTDPGAFAAARGDLAALSFRIEPPSVRLAVLSSLGKPPAWRRREELADSLEPVYTAASALAQAVALGEDPQSIAPEPAEPAEETDQELFEGYDDDEVVGGDPDGDRVDDADADDSDRDDAGSDDSDREDTDRDDADREDTDREDTDREDTDRDDTNTDDADTDESDREDSDS